MTYVYFQMFGASITYLFLLMQFDSAPRLTYDKCARNSSIMKAH